MRWSGTLPPPPLQVGSRLRRRRRPSCWHSRLPVVCAVPPLRAAVVLPSQLLFLLLLLRSFPKLLLLGRSDCAQRVQVSVLVLVQGGCLGRRRVGCRPSHFCVLGDRQITSSPLLPPLPRRSGCVCFVCWCCVAAVLGRMRGGVPQTMSMLYLIQQNALRIYTSTRTPYSS